MAENTLDDLSRLANAQERTIDGLRADLKTEKADNAALRGENERLRAAIEAARCPLRIIFVDDLETWEEIAVAFHRDTGFLRPGKDEPAAKTFDQQERMLQWRNWCIGKFKLAEELITAALAAHAEQAPRDEEGGQS